MLKKKPPPDIKPRLQSRAMTAKQLNVHLRTVDEVIKDGKLVTVQLGRRRMVTVASVERLLAGEVAG